MSDPFTRAREDGFRKGMIKAALNPRSAIFEAIPAAMKGEFAAGGARLYKDLQRNPDVGSGLFSSLLQGYRQVDDIDRLRAHFAPLRSRAWKSRMTNPEGWRTTRSNYRDAMREAFAQLGSRAAQRERLLSVYPRVAAGAGIAGTGAYVAGDYLGKRDKTREVQQTLQQVPFMTRLKYLMNPTSVV